MIDPAEWPSTQAQIELEQFLAEHGLQGPSDMNWEHVAELAGVVGQVLGKDAEDIPFLYRHPADLQLDPNADPRPYSVRMAAVGAGETEAPLALCLGGIANTAHRFDVLAGFLRRRYRVVALDWAGRGGSGWLRELGDYGFESCVTQARALLDHLGGRAEVVIGSSVGGSVAIRMAAETPEQIGRLVLNDVGPIIPQARRQMRARVIGRHYVFAEPTDLFRRTGAAQKKDGPVEDAVLLHNSWYTTRWSDEDGGRVYRHDLRALLAYREEARNSLDLSHEWLDVRCPVLVLHGLLSDNLIEAIWKPMTVLDHVCIRHVPRTGHTPVLSDFHTVHAIDEWLEAPPGALAREETLPLPVERPRLLFARHEGS